MTTLHSIHGRHHARHEETALREVEARRGDTGGDIEREKARRIAAIVNQRSSFTEAWRKKTFSEFHPMSAPTTDPAFVGVGKEAGLTLWRIENKLVVKQAVVSDTCRALVGGVTRSASVDAF